MHSNFHALKAHLIDSFFPIYLLSAEEQNAFFPSSFSVKAFLQDLNREHVTVAAFTELCNQLLQDYATDDTRRVKEVMDKTVVSWNSINNRYTH